MAKQKTEDIETIIQRAVEAATLAAVRSSVNAYAATEKRLYALPVLREKVKDDKEKLDELMVYGRRSKSKSIVRYQSTGSRLSPEEVEEALVNDLRASIERDSREIERLERALEKIKGDPYYFTVEWRYFRDMDDAAIGARAPVPREASTIRKNRKRLVQRVAVRLYGASAIY